MVPVTLDFRASPASGSRLGRMLAIVGALALIITFLSFGLLLKKQFDLNNKLDIQKTDLRRNLAANSAAAAVDPEGEIARHLSRPWQKLLLALESVSDPKAVLLEIRPDPVRGQIRLVAEAGTLDEALDYLRRLQKLPELQQSHLVSYATVPTAGGAAALRFIIQANWMVGS